MSKTLYIINPAGNGGAGLKAWAKFKEQWSEDISQENIIYTERPLHALDIVSRAIKFNTIVSVGGDGTVNESIQGVLKNKSKPSLGIIPAGTGNDIARNVGIESLKDAVVALKQNQIRNYDLMETRYGKEIRYSFLTTNFGFSANHRIQPWMKRILGPRIAYYLATLLELISFRPWDMAVEWDNDFYRGKASILIIANVERSSGGSMKIGPGATPSDGKLTVTIVPFKSKISCLLNEFPKLPQGRINEMPNVKFFQTRSITVKSDPPTDIDFDGEIYGTTPAAVKILPLALNVISLVK